MKKVNKEFMSAAEIKEQRLNLLYKILPIISILLLIALWLAASRGSANFPSPQDVLNRTIRLFTHPVKKKNLILHVLASLRRIGLALLFDWTFGIVFGIILGWFPKARAFFSPIFDAFRAVPPLAWIPLITLWFGTGETPKILIVIFGSLACIVVNVKAGLSAHLHQRGLDGGAGGRNAGRGRRRRGLPDLPRHGFDGYAPGADRHDRHRHRRRAACHTNADCRKVDLSVDQKNKVILKLENISKSYIVKNDVKLVVDKVSMEVRDNEFLVVLGPGHCGKSVLMNIIAGLETPNAGRLTLDGEELHGSDKRIGMVFQTLNLMPWRTVMGNVEFGLEIAGMDKTERRKIAQKYIDLVGLTGFENAYPHQLSGGMKQRVGIARAYTNSPEILLMDEPFGQLDAQTRYAMQEEVLRIWEQEKRTIIFVTNNIEEAVYLADRVVLLSNCPAQVKQVYDLSVLSRPRSMTDPEFLRIRKDISDNTDLAL